MTHESQLPVKVLDLFAGPGGWDEGLLSLGVTEVLGIEWDDAACATREAAGHATLQANVAELNPSDFPCIGLIASPPCQAWSMAGKGGGQRDKARVLKVLDLLADGLDHRRHNAERCEDPRSMLAVEPLRWAVALRPEWICCEQVPPCLELWERTAALLTELGYSTWAGILEAERYGVPQTRERALESQRDRVVSAAIQYDRCQEYQHDDCKRAHCCHPAGECLRLEELTAITAQYRKALQNGH
jgi:DNA (cytosine-5)-methyltransferase 1